MLVMVSVLLYIQSAFSGLVDGQLLTIWLCWMWACVLVFSTAVSALLIPPLRVHLPAIFFIRVGQGVAMAFCLGIVASVWILMPVADPHLRMLMVLLSMWFIAMVIVLNPDTVSIYGALFVVLSMASFVLVYDMPYAWALAGFLVGEGVALVAIRRLIWRAADEFEAAMEIAASERDAKTRFIASASHDLQQPIQAAWMFAESAIAAEGDVAKAIAGMRSSFASVQALLESMLDHLRLEAGAVMPRRELVSLQPLLAEVIAEHEEPAAAAGMKVTSVATSLSVSSDRALLKRAIGNLVTNAVRHSRGKRAVVGARRAGRSITIWVLDDGIGIAPSDRANLFDEFAQGRANPAGAGGGFGIGLSSVRRIAELLGGSANHDPRWCAGAAFALTLPD